MKNLLHELIDNIDRWMHMVRRFRGASTPQELPLVLTDWLALRSQVWQAGLTPAQAECNGRTEIISWWVSRGLDDDGSHATIERAVKCVVTLAVHQPLASLHYNEAPRRNEARWREQTALLAQAQADFVDVCGLAKRIGDGTRVNERELPPPCPECSEVPEKIVEIIEVVVETREDVERLEARQAAEAASVRR